ncbi:MAG: alanine--tRNA ligase [Candidatus Bipolaricaulota bacterium]|nr:alanine--tRNA ligase [Candidatus Bipolaricaulota bacterium]
MQAHELRKRYISYFVEHNHHHLPSAPLVPNDPSLLFTAAGMVQFKDIFWGHVAPTFPRVTTCQKCFRTTDIENVGKTAYHHTFFEMLGNFSFGDYFKEQAIKYAWDFLTSALDIPAERLWVSVYEEDDEAFAIWNDEIGIPRERIAKLGKEHNWWGPVGNSGPCGPDTEIFFDAGEDRACGPNCRGVACDCDRFSEIWNLVFMQYDAQEDGSLVPLKKKSVDTGMGLERTATVLQGAKTDFDINLFLPTLEAIQAAVPRSLTDADTLNRNIVADHIKGILFLIADGVLPSNEKQGYVLRRVLRRAIRSGEKLGLPRGSLPSLVDPVIDTLGDVYPEIVTARPLAQRVISHEEKTFRKTLRAGEARLERILQRLAGEGTRMLPGELAFELYDTYGFPMEMTEEIVSEHNIDLDTDGFRSAMAQQRQRSRKSADENTHGKERATLDVATTEFLGYKLTNASGRIAHNAQQEDDTLKLAFDRTPFYAESGGQIADRGTIENLTRPGRGEIIDVKKTKSDVFLHTVKVTEGTFEVTDECNLVVDTARREQIARNHTATHLLHAALREVLGEHVIQAGSYVGDTELRFDFSHFERVTEDELARVEDLANAVALQDLPVTTSEMSLVEAKKTGAMAHFEDEYRGKDVIRVVSIGDFSRELCGGTHVSRTGEIGLIKIISEESIAAGVRRMRAVTGDGTLAWVRRRDRLLTKIERTLGDDPITGLNRLQQEKASLEENLATLSTASLTQIRDDLLARREEIGGTNVFAERVDADGAQLKELADLVEEKGSPAVVLLLAQAGGKGIAVCKISDELEVNAGKIVRTLTAKFGGGGGGNRTFAQGGGLRADSLDQALQKGTEAIRSALA